MAITGPVPKRSVEKRRRNTRTEAGESLEVETVSAPREAPPVEAPETPEHWHDMAKAFFEGVKKSIFTKFYEPSDWQVLMISLESLSRDLKPQFVGVNLEGEPIMQKTPIKGASLNAYSKIWASLLLTDGDRRRLRLEIERDGAGLPAEPSEEQVQQSRDGLFAVQGGKA
jgi:hypothetical protein